MTVDSLTLVRRAALRRDEAEARFKGAIFAANAEGHSLRKIGAAAGVSHSRVLQIVRGETAIAGEPYVEHLEEHERRYAAEIGPLPVDHGPTQAEFDAANDAADEERRARAHGEAPEE